MPSYLSAMNSDNKSNKKDREYDLNTLLQIANAVVFAANIYLYVTSTEHNPYINATTIFWSFIIALQVGVILFFEKRRRNPLVILLAMNIIGNYLARVLTLQIYPMSGVLIMTRMSAPLDVHDINNTLPFIFMGTWAIMAGLSAPILKAQSGSTASALDGSGERVVDVGRIMKPGIIMVIFGISMLSGVCFTFMKHLGDIASVGDRLMSYVNMLLCHDVIVLIVLAFLFTQRRRISRRNFKMIVMMFVVYLVLRLLQGSRSGMLMVAMTTLSVWLARYGYVRVKMKLVMIALLLVLPVSVISFSIATTIRQVSGVSRNEVYSEEKMEEVREMSMARGYANSDNEFILSMIFARIAYLTDATDVIANYERYGNLVNIEHIFMSIVDSTSPGFNVFDAGRISNRLKNVYTNQDLKFQYPASEYQSDALTVFGEYYALFRGYFGLIPMFVMAYLFKIFYVYIRNRWGRDGFCSICYGALTLIIFRLWIDSYGTDWVILEGGRMVVMSAMFIYLMTYLSRKKLVFRQPTIVGH